MAIDDSAINEKTLSSCREFVQSLQLPHNATYLEQVMSPQLFQEGTVLIGTGSGQEKLRRQFGP